MNVKIALILVAAALLIFYRFVFPWTPFWIDISLVIAAGLVALWQWGAKTSRRGEQDKDNNDREQ